MSRRNSVRVIGGDHSFNPILARDLLRLEIGDQDWVVDKLIPIEGITVISGAPKSYKSWIALHIALCISEGKDVFGKYPTKKSDVLIIDEENNRRIIKQRLEKLNSPTDSEIRFVTQENLSIEDSDHRKAIKKLCVESDTQVIILDSLIRIHRADENSAGEMAEVFAGIKELASEGRTVIVLHHERKETGYKSSAQMRMRGSSDISAAVDSHLSVRKDPADQTKMLVEQAQLRCAPPEEPFEVQLEETDDKISFQYIGSTEVTKKETALEKSITAVRLLLEKHPEGLLHKEIVDTLQKSDGLGVKNVRNAIKELKEDDLLQEMAGDKGNEKVLKLIAIE